MDTLQLVITAVSVVVAVVASVIAWRVTRAAGRRSAARVAPLAAAADVTNIRAEARAAAPAPAELLDFAPTTSGDGAQAPAGGLFGTPIADSGSGTRQHGLLAAAAVVAVLVGGAGLIFVVGGRGPAAPIAAATTPLELVALGHTRIDGQLAVSGVVRNPAGATAADALEAHVRVFDAAGIMIVTRSAPLDTVSLTPGAEAPFSVTMGPAETAARYRVSFASRGTMLAHVDRRTNLPAAVTADAR